MKTISLTSPLTRGPHVVRMQAALKRGNIFQADFLHGPQDGLAGEGTCRAFIRSKYWAGYGSGSLHPYGGDELYNYLTGVKPLGPMMKIRRARRIAAAKETPVGVKALNLARAELGEKEWPAGTNRVKYSAWYGLTGPWCAMFVSWCLDRAGSKFHYAYCPYVVNDARAGKNGLQVVSFEAAKTGDLALYNWDGDWDADHIGFLEQKTGGFSFDAIEGNTAVGNDSNGGEVMRRRRSRSQVQAFVRVGA